MIRPAIGVALATVVLGSAAVRAEVIPGRWEKVEAQQPGTRIALVLKSGERISDAGFKSIDATGLVVETAAGERRVARDEASRVETSFVVKDPVSDGVGIGLLSGTLMGVLSAALADTPERDSVKWPTAILFNAGLGSLVGCPIDKNTQGPEVLYRSK